MTKRTSRYTSSSACALRLTMHYNCVRDPLVVCVRFCPCAPCCIDSVYVPCTRRLGWWSMPTCNLSVRKFTTRSCSAWNQLRLRQAKTARASSTRYGSQVLAPLSSTIIYPSVTLDICIFRRQLYTNVHDTMIAEHSNVNKLYKISTEQVHRNQPQLPLFCEPLSRLFKYGVVRGLVCVQGAANRSKDQDFSSTRQMTNGLMQDLSQANVLGTTAQPRF